MRIPAHRLLTHSLRKIPIGENISRVLAASLAAVDPGVVIQDLLQREKNLLKIPGADLDLNTFRRIFLIGIGKAATPMFRSLADLISDRLTEGYILNKTIPEQMPQKSLDRSRYFVGGHPIPDKDGQEATTEILSSLSTLNSDDLVVILISGGSSALFTQPAEGISLSDLQETNQILLSCGADIQGINTIRKHLSLVKGGQLAKFLQPGRVLSLILSDVIGDQVDLIGSGPTAPDPSTYADAMDVVETYHLNDKLPVSVITRLEQGLGGLLPETPKPGDACFTKVTNLVLANNRKALEAGAAQANKEGFSSSILPSPLIGESSQAGRNLASHLSALALEGKPKPRPACLIAGGETTVTLSNTKSPGQGGRNLEIALSALPLLNGLENIAFITLATDGEDGSTNAAGAVVTGESYLRCQQLGLDPEEFLLRHDSFPLFKALDDLLLPGPTGTNVNDLCFLFTF